MGRLAPVLQVRTPEGVRFEYGLAEVPARAGAWLLDLLIMGGVAVLVSWLAAWLGALWADLGLALQAALLGMLLWGWPAAWEAARGWTPGKWLLGLRVVRIDGAPVAPADAMLRNVLRLVDVLPVAGSVGAFSMAIDPLRRRLGDRVAGTVVVRVPPLRSFAELLRVQGIDERRVERLAGLDAAVARLTAVERSAVQALLRRREELPSALRRELVVGLAEHLQRRLRVPCPAHLTPEGYLLSVAYAALRRGERLRAGGFS